MQPRHAGDRTVMQHHFSPSGTAIHEKQHRTSCPAPYLFIPGQNFTMSGNTTKDDYDLQKKWNEVCDSFARTTKEDLSKHPKFTPDEVLEQIRLKQDRDEAKNAKYKAAKDILSKTLDCIDNLGNIAAQGASMV
jgi:hypothetical protein